MSEIVRNMNSDLMTFFQSPILNRLIKKYASNIINKEDREDAILDAWADIMALKPIGLTEASRLARAAIMRAYRNKESIDTNEISADMDRLF